jgi:RNA recognition motif-containing protein
MNKKLFVGGLPYAVTDDRLEEVFAAHGAVESARVVTDKFTGQSRGFGFVEMSSPAEASTAVTALNETDLDGRTITVAEARPREDRSRW